MKLKLEEKLGLLKYNFDKEAHIKVKTDECDRCNVKPCVTACPAGCFKLQDEKLVFTYEDCIECGTCRIICPRSMIEWNYPRGTFGVSFRYG